VTYNQGDNSELKIYPTVDNAHYTYWHGLNKSYGVITNYGQNMIFYDGVYNSSYYGEPVVVKSFSSGTNLREITLFSYQPNANMEKTFMISQGKTFLYYKSTSSYSVSLSGVPDIMPANDVDVYMTIYNIAGQDVYWYVRRHNTWNASVNQLYRISQVVEGGDITVPYDTSDLDKVGYGGWKFWGWIGSDNQYHLRDGEFIRTKSASNENLYGDYYKVASLTVINGNTTTTQYFEVGRPLSEDSRLSGLEWQEDILYMPDEPTTVHAIYLTVTWNYYDMYGKINPDYDVFVDTYNTGDTITERPLFRAGESSSHQWRWSAHPSVMGNQNIVVDRQYLRSRIQYRVNAVSVNSTVVLRNLSANVYCLSTDSVSDMVPASISNEVSAVQGIYISSWNVTTDTYEDEDGVYTYRIAEAVISLRTYNVYYYDVNDTYDYYLNHSSEWDEYEAMNGTDALIAITTTLVHQDTFTYGEGIQTSSGYAYHKENCHVLNSEVEGFWYVNDGADGAPACDIDVYRYGCPDYWDDSTVGNTGLINFKNAHSNAIVRKHFDRT
jgi:hypothetical protein